MKIISKKDQVNFRQDFAIVLAWPETMISGAGSWYDKFLSNEGKYRAGHSAVILISYSMKKSIYFDFGRYQTPIGFGRVRDMETDSELELVSPKFSNKKITNIKEILKSVYSIKSLQVKGKMYVSLVENISFKLAYNYAKKTQAKGIVEYGPFNLKGTNCSRFVANVLKKSKISILKRLRLSFPFCISPSPKRNIAISNQNYYVFDTNSCLYVKKNKLKAYFSSIESYESFSKNT